MTAFLVGVAVLGIAGLIVAWSALIRARQLHRWGRGYVRHALRRPQRGHPPVHVIVCVADHFEPAWGGAALDVQRARVSRWVTGYPELARRHRDSAGRPYQHTFFYPAEEYVPEHLDALAALRREGFGDVEVHLHHDGDTSEGLRATLEQFATTLQERHGLLRRDETGQVRYGFIHGNWALDNSRPDGRWCGVNDELTVLAQTGCYADFTLPSAPSETQTGKINSIYYATDDPERPKSHDTGVDVRVGGGPSGDLLLVQGPLTLNWARRKWGLLPRIENGELSFDAPPSATRADLWVRQGIHVRGRPEWRFIKLHTHGAQEANADVLLGSPMDALLSDLERRYNDGERYQLHYVTAWELYRLVKAAERGEVAASVRRVLNGAF
jgi:hypothetical protein